MKKSMIEYNVSNIAGLQAGLQPKASLKVDPITMIFLEFQNIFCV